MIRFALPLVALAAAGCYENRPEPDAPPVMEAACKSEPLAGLVGKTRSDAVSKEALRLSGAKAIRWISPGMAVTMDFRTDRLNLDVDAQGKITRAHCG
jgi:hypothetical protein